MVIFSSTVILFVAFGCGLIDVPGIGGGGSGGSWVGLPGAEVRTDFLLIEAPDRLLLCLGDGLG
jgi:hypothetical protein